MFAMPCVSGEYEYEYIIINYYNYASNYIIYSEVPPVPTARTPLIRLSVSGLSFRLWSVVLTPLLS